MALLNFVLIRSSFSCCVASFFNISSKIPPASPAATIFMYTGENTLGCLARESAKLVPLSTSLLTSEMWVLKISLSVWFCKVARLLTRGTPAFIIVANCLVKTVMSLDLTFFFVSELKKLPPPAFLIDTGLSPCFASSAPSAASLAESAVPWRCLPFLSTALYVNFGILFPCYSQNFFDACHSK